MTGQIQEKTNGKTALERKSPVQARPLSLFSFDPFRSFETMRRLMDFRFDFPYYPEEEYGPALNLYEKDGKYFIECAVPGYKKDDISVEARDSEVKISGSYAYENEHKNRYHRKEFRQSSFTRVVELPEAIDAEHVEAKLENGMLKIALQPMHAAAGKKIAIS
jgi:HSP20 family protein